MVWLFATVVFLTVVWLLVVSETARKVALWGVIALVALGGWFYFDGQRKERLAVTSIRPEEVELSQLTLYYSYSWHLKGTVKNRSASKALDSLTVNIKVSDCRSKPCEIVADEDVPISERTPPGQTRFFDVYTTLEDQALPDGWTWSYQVKEVRAATN